LLLRNVCVTDIDHLPTLRLPRYLRARISLARDEPSGAKGGCISHRSVASSAKSARSWIIWDLYASSPAMPL